MVLPTGSGKSAVVNIAAEVEKDSLTIVLAPLIAVKANWEKELEQAKLMCSIENKEACLMCSG